MATLSSSPRTTRITVPSATVGPFPLNFRLFDSDGLAVYVDGAASVAWDLDATFANGFADDAAITFTAPISAGSVVQMDGALIADRELDYVNGDPNLTEKLNIELARLWSAIAETKMEASRSLRGFDPSAPIPDIDVADILTIGDRADEAAASAVAAAASAATALEKENSMLRVRGPWITSTDYSPSDLVFFDGAQYSVEIPHTAGDFAVDLATGKMRIFLPKGLPGEGSGDMLRSNSGVEYSATAATFRSNLGLIIGTDLPALRAGQIGFFLTGTVPDQFLELDGSTISRVTYAALFAAIGAISGPGNGTTTFTLPDMRGVGLRGWDHGRGLDVGRALGSYQDDAIQDHIHGLNAGVGGPLQVLGSQTARVAGIGPGIFSEGFIYRGAGGGRHVSPPSNIDGTVGGIRTATETRVKTVAVLMAVCIGPVVRSLPVFVPPVAITALSITNNVVDFTLSAPGTIHWSVDDNTLVNGATIDAGTGAYASGNFTGTASPATITLDFTGVPAGLRRAHFVATTTGDTNYGIPQHFNTTVVVVGAPVNTAPPVIPASAIPGTVLTMTGFAFTGSGLTYEYRWLLNGTVIFGQTAASYTVLTTDVSDVLLGQVRATDSLGRQSDWISSNDIIPAAEPIVFSSQNSLNSAIYVVGATVIITLAVANATVGISEFSLNGVDKRSELVQVSATTFNWNSTGEAPGAIVYQCTGSSASETKLSNRVTATLNAGAITVPLIMASGDWSIVNEGSGGKLTATVINAAGNGGSAITNYELQKDGVTTIALGITQPGSAVTSGHSLTVSGSYLIRAVNSAGNGPWSITPKVVTASDILAPETVSFLYDTPTNAATITRSESAKTYYLVNSSAVALSGPNIKAQVLAATPVVFGQINIGTAEVTPNLAALGAAGTFVLHQALEDASGNVEPFGQFIQFDWPGATDLVAPVLSLPVDNASGSSASTGSVTTDKLGGTLSVVDSTSATAPSAAQIEAGQMHTGAAAASFTSYAVGATGVQAVASMGLAPSTTYFKHFVQRSASGVLSNVVSGNGFTTAVASADVEFVSSTLMISTTATGDGPAYVSATNHTVSAQANRVVVLMIRGTWDLVAPPTISDCTFGGVAATILQQPIGTGGRAWCALAIAIAPAAGARGCTVTLSATQRAFSVRAIECKNVNQATPSEAVGSVSDIATTLGFSRTTVTNGNMLLSTVNIDSGGYQADITAINGATLIAGEQTGTTISSDHSAGAAYEPVPTAGANGHGYNWITNDGAALSWVELARA